MILGKDGRSCFHDEIYNSVIPVLMTCVDINPRCGIALSD